MDNFEKVPKGIFDKVTNNKELFISEFKEKLEEVFPAAVKDGIVDFEALLNEFGKYAETDEKEKYNMTWVGKKDAIRKANEDIVGKTLKYVPEDSKNPDTTKNLYIEGDNLEVLKLLRNSYYGKVKMVYIDPPYNTGNDFVYNDTFKIDKEEYEKAIGAVDEYNERLTASKKGSGRYHSGWINMMYSRLKVAKDLLTDDGVIFISIDDNEYVNLKKICDDIFGESNGFQTLIWKKKYTGGKHSKTFADYHEYIVGYCKNIDSIGEILMDRPENEKGKFEYEDEYSAERGKYYIRPLKSNLDPRPTLVYPIALPDGTSITTQWIVAKDTFDSMLHEGRILFKMKKDGNYQVYKKYYEKDGGGKVKIPSIIEFVSNNDAKEELKNIFGIKQTRELPFQTPKPIKLLEFLIDNFSDKYSIVLDFFSGSSSTAHSTMQLNAEDGGNRKFIMVQLPELCDEKSNAYKAGYNNICEIGKERIKRAGDKILEENKDKEGIEKLDVGFKVFRVADTNIRWISDNLSKNISMDEYRNDMSSKDQLDFNPHFTDIDVVYEMMLKRQDLELTERIDKLQDIGDRTYLVGYTVLVCLEEKITEEMVKKISEIDTSLSWIVFRDSAFGDDINLKTNTMNLLRTLIKEKNPKSKNQKILWI